MNRPVSFLMLPLILSGCALLRKGEVTPPAASVTLAGGAKLDQTGSAQVPAKVTSDVVSSVVPVPAGSTVIVDEKKPGVISVQLSGQTEVRTEARKESAEAPKAFTPPAPPTPSETADGQAQLYYRIGLVIGIAAALFGLVRDYTLLMIGGAAVAGGCLIALFVKAHPLVLVLIGAGVALKIAGPALWHLKLKHLEPKSP